MRRRLNLNFDKSELGGSLLLSTVGLLLAFQQPEFQRQKKRGRKFNISHVDSMVLFAAMADAEKNNLNEKECIKKYIRHYKKIGLLSNHADAKTHKMRLFRHHAVFRDVILNEVKRAARQGALAEALLAQI